MTAVARFSFLGHPVMVADLLVTAEADGRRPAYVPTAESGDVAKLFGPQHPRVPAGLKQKLALLSDYLVLGWSGTVLAAHDVIGELRWRMEDDRFTSRSLDEYFGRQRASVWEELGLVGYIRDPDDRILKIGLGDVSFSHPIFGHVGLLGSGTESLRRSFEEQAVGDIVTNVGLGRLRSVELGYIGALRASSIFHTQDVLNGENLLQHFGGGYEVVTMNGGRFVMLDDISYLFWTAEYDGFDNVRLQEVPVRAIKYHYENDLLYMRSVASSWEERGWKMTSRTDVIQPPHRYLTPSDYLPNVSPSMNSQWLCNTVFVNVRMTTPNSAYSLVLTKRQLGAAWVNFNEAPQGMCFSVDRNFLEEVVGNIRNSDALRGRT